uniref:aminotransferase class I/II-fold pyridoxal phosphate-dependent enzyme n=1 Tax=uncultured Eubacterium sp. TaxID=165185 RepID=UPI003425FFCB
PGHKRQSMGNWTGEEIDITEITGFDNLHHAEGILREAQCRAAKTFGADETFFLINGSTAGLLAAVCGTVKKGGRLLMARNCHKAVYHAVYLMELKTSYLYPKQTAFGIQGSISPEQVKTMLEQWPDTEAVLLTSPTYDGVLSDIAAIAEIVHAKGIPLIVDEAHGAHFGFSKGFPQKALALGADLCIESAHKTLPAYTQSALLHYRKNPWVDLERVKWYLGIYQSSSPSYILMAGLDRCTRILREQGTELFAAYEERLHDFYEKCKTLQQITVLSPDGKIEETGEKDPGIWDRDPSKILICTEKVGLHGQQLAELLTERYHLEMEMVSGHYVTALTTLMDTTEGFNRLFAALQEIDHRDDVGLNQGIFTTDEIYHRTEKVLEIAEAMDAPKQTVSLMESAGSVSGEFVYLYPPGIPILAPGERVTEEILKTLRICQTRNMEVEGMKDYSGQRIEVCTIL